VVRTALDVDPHLVFDEELRVLAAFGRTDFEYDRHAALLETK
jgi:hypothetical protein